MLVIYTLLFYNNTNVSIDRDSYRDSLRSKDNTFSTNFNFTNNAINNNPSNNKNLYMGKSSNLKVIKEEEKIEDNDIIYYPFTFNKILEHFNRKGKIKDNLDNIKSSIVK